MRKYETLLLFNPDLGEEEHKAALEVLTGVLTREQSEILLVDDWGMRELAYPVKKQMRGHYVRLEYLAKPETIHELERNIRINEPVFRFVTVLLDEAPAAEEAA